MWEIIPCSRNSQMNEWIKISKLTRRFAKNFLLPQVLSNALTVRDSQAWKHDHNDQLKNHIVNCQDVNHPKLRIATQKLVPNSKKYVIYDFCMCHNHLQLSFESLVAFEQLSRFILLFGCQQQNRCHAIHRNFVPSSEEYLLRQTLLVYFLYLSWC